MSASNYWMVTHAGAGNYRAWFFQQEADAAAWIGNLLLEWLDEMVRPEDAGLMALGREMCAALRRGDVHAAQLAQEAWAEAQEDQTVSRFYVEEVPLTRGVTFKRELLAWVAACCEEGRRD